MDAAPDGDFDGAPSPPVSSSVRRLSDERIQWVMVKDGYNGIANVKMCPEENMR
jgi:hypothetical protein